MVLLIGGLTYLVMHNQIAHAIRSSLRADAALFAEHVETNLSSITTTLSGLSRNTVLANALMDSVARSTYIEPFLHNLHLINMVPVEITLTDFEGMPIAGHRALSLVDEEWARPVLARGEAQARLVIENGNQWIIVAEPIFYYRTQSPEGALVYRVSLESLLKRVQHDQEHRTVRLTHRSTLDHHHHEGSARHAHRGSEDDNQLVEYQPVYGGRTVQELGLGIEVAANRALLNTPLNKLLGIYTVVGTLAIIIVLLIGWGAGRRLGRPIREFERVARQVVASGSFDHRFRTDGLREIADLGETFNDMLSRLAAACQELKKLAQFDSLTTLANRRLFCERLDQALAQAGRNSGVIAVLLLDLDRFKEINDVYGHLAGDALLRQVADRLRRHVRSTDMVARLGGDEFAIIATNLSGPDDAALLAAKLSNALRVPFVLEGNTVVVTGSIGISLSSADKRTSDGMMRNADLALYQTKLDDRNSHCFYNAAMNERMLARRHVETNIRHALEHEGFSLLFQPKVDLMTGGVVGAEALLRCSAQGFTSPITELISVAESTGLIASVGEWVLREACRQAKKWRLAGLPLLPIAVNVSPVHLRRPEFVETVLRIMENAEVLPGQLELEITESAMMERVDAVTQVVSHLHDIGLRIAIDDFGTGYSSLLYLKRFPVDALKIDISFIDGVTSSDEDAAITRAIIALTQSLGIRSVAEGVETEDQMNFLRTHGCHEAQGFLVAHPMPGDALITWWQNRCTESASETVSSAAE